MALAHPKAVDDNEHYTYASMTAELQTLSAQYPNLLRFSVEGHSLDNRVIWSVTLGSGPKNILVTGALHGSEWITTYVLVRTIEAYVQEHQDLQINGTDFISSLISK